MTGVERRRKHPVGVSDGRTGWQAAAVATTLRIGKHNCRYAGIT
jgi:hypothetical protein